MQTFTNYGQYQTGYKPSLKSSASSIKFGDAVYLRNSKFETSVQVPKDSFRLQQKLQTLSGPAKEIADFITRKEKPLFDATGRLPRGSKALPFALGYAAREYELRQKDLKTNPSQDAHIAKDLAGVKLANLQLASDESETANKKAFQLLSRSLNSLATLGYPQESVTPSPVFIHGLYNRGTYAFNNDLYRANQKAWTAAQIKEMDEDFEGLAVGHDSSIQLKKMKEGMPYLERAIELADSIPDHHLSKSEYIIAKGEMHHAIAHLGDSNPEELYNHSRKSRESFAKALEILESLEKSQPEHFTPRHNVLKAKLKDIKIPHLCEEKHRSTTSDGSNVCGTGMHPPWKSRLSMFDIFFGI